MKNICILILIVLNTSILCQESKEGKFGIGISKELNQSSNEYNLTIWVNNYVFFEPQFGFLNINTSSTSGTNFRFGLGVLYAINNSDVTPYTGLRFKTATLSGGSNTYNDIIFSLVFGGEYFVSKWFSTGIEMQLNYVKTDSEMSPMYGITNSRIIYSDQLLFIKIYFN